MCRYIKKTLRNWKKRELQSKVYIYIYIYIYIYTLQSLYLTTFTESCLQGTHLDKNTKTINK